MTGAQEQQPAAAGRCVRRSPRAVFRRLSGDEGAVVLHLDTAAYHGLNEVGSLIWELIDDGTTMDALVAALRTRIDAPPRDFAEHVEEFVAALAARDLLVVDREA